MTAALIIIAVGIVFLLQNLGFFTSSVWGAIWPIILIIVGISMLFGKFSLGSFRSSRHDKEEKKEDK